MCLNHRTMCGYGKANGHLGTGMPGGSGGGDSHLLPGSTPSCTHSAYKSLSSLPGRPGLCTNACILRRALQAGTSKGGAPGALAGRAKVASCTATAWARSDSACVSCPCPASSLHCALGAAALSAFLPAASPAACAGFSLTKGKNVRPPM